MFKVDKKKLADAGMVVLVTGLKGAKAALDTSSIPGASVIFLVILSCIEEAQKASRNADILKNARLHLDAILDILRSFEAVPQDQQDQTVSDALQEAAQDLVIYLSKEAEIVEKKTTHIRPAWMTRSLDEEALEDFVKAVENALEQFQLAQGNRVERLIGAIRLQTQGEAWDRTLSDLKRAPQAGYNAERPGTITGCADQTRVEVLAEIDDWIADPGADRVYWLKERAGFGKTAIALSVAQRAAERGELAASFFFSHQVPDLSTAGLFFPTLAFQLARYSQCRYQQLFAEAVRKSPDASAARLSHQVEALFLNPLRQVEPTSAPLVIVVDALDECNPEHAQELVKDLIQAVESIPLPIRLFITSRPENHLTGAFEEAGVSSRRITDSSEEDVATYLRKELADIPRALHLSDLPRDWISGEEIDALIKQAGGLFVYASTAIRFIRDPTALNPRKHLEILLRDDEVQSAVYRPFGPLDLLYRRILDLAIGERKHLVDEVHTVLGGRIVIQPTLTLDLLARLLALAVGDVRRTLVKLQSVVVCTDTSEGEVTIYHASFKDFLLDSSRSGSSYFIDAAAHHHRVALQSIQIITQSPFRREVENDMKADDFVVHSMVNIPDEVEYALTWVFHHIVEADKDIALRTTFDSFFQQRSLWWLEPYWLTECASAIADTYSWRAEESDAPSGLAILKLYGSFHYFCKDRNERCFYLCCAFARKQLRRYFQLASAASIASGSNSMDSDVITLHKRVEECLNAQVSLNEDLLLTASPLELVGGRCSEVIVRFAYDLANVVDKFALSMGHHDEVEASKQQMEYLGSRLLGALVDQGIATDNQTGETSHAPREDNEENGDEDNLSIGVTNNSNHDDEWTAGQRCPVSSASSVFGSE